ncbi:MAG: hypothetical protein JSC189_000756 [Candidatus Tokpelaia sp. JSC189]|nr:MAG: hypothetical protein JSC189_000756 [Candidatus Tokpelaia sp. JSC189]
MIVDDCVVDVFPVMRIETGFLRGKQKEYLDILDGDNSDLLARIVDLEAENDELRAVILSV